jgi:hypothetical protein
MKSLTNCEIPSCKPAGFELEIKDDLDFSGPRSRYVTKESLWTPVCKKSVPSIAARI